MITDTLINTYMTNYQGGPSTAALTDGGFIVCWQSYNQNGDGFFDVYAQRYDASGVARGDEFRINTKANHTDNQRIPSIAALADGGFVVSWESYNQDGDGLGVYARHYAANGEAQGGEFLINTVIADNQSNPSVAALADGGFVVTWNSYNQDGNEFGIYAQRYAASGAELGREFLVNTTTASSQINPSITALADGGFVVSWASHGQDGDSYGIFAQRYDSVGEVQGAEFLVNTTTASHQMAPSITAFIDGGFVVTWNSYNQDGSGYGVYAQRYDANGAELGREFRINTATASDQVGRSTAALTDGGFVVTWQSFGQDGDGLGVYAQRYDANGEIQGGEFRVNTTSTGHQSNSSVTALADGGFVVSWDSYGQDGSDYGVYAKRYDADGNEIEWMIPPDLTSLPTADRLYNWAESIYSDLFPNHPTSQDVFGYYARVYENGNALGEQNDHIYFYDGISITLVGTVDDFLPDAMAAGF
ncbi:hypothetical protein [Nitrosomonas sp.]|uniref:hypothetical protein n=1 Tax=Nitrosomonas sp. TaxID=42353 RepID=UPI00260F649C|nr:hypothetical protein [Nitrosomonas sp.]MCW5600131.1 hypothetical protein [Nitrosomonas sp.]